MLLRAAGAMHAGMKKFLALALLSAASAMAADPAPVSITSAEAKDHIGELAIVRGPVVQVSTIESGMTFFNFGQRHPDSEFTAVIRKGPEQYGDINRFKGKEVEVEGKIEAFKERPQIVITDPSQIRLPGEAAAPSAEAKAAASPAAEKSGE